MAVSEAGSMRDVSYSCGRCAFKLNLSSSDRLISSIGPRYSKASRKGILCFLSIDESRFRMFDEVKCGPYFESPGKWGIQRMRTTLQCRNCGALVGHLQVGPASGFSCLNGDSGADSGKRFCIRIRALQPEQVGALDDSEKIVSDPLKQPVEQRQQQVEDGIDEEGGGSGNLTESGKLEEAVVRSSSHPQQVPS